MTSREKYQIMVHGILVEVTREVYLAYYSMERHARTLEEKDTRNGKVLYSDLDTEETLGEEMIPDSDPVCVEDAALDHILLEQLHQCLLRLSTQEQDLINALYFKGLSERAYAKRIGISQKGVNKRRRKILKKLRQMMKN